MQESCFPFIHLSLVLLCVCIHFYIDKILLLYKCNIKKAEVEELNCISICLQWQNRNWKGHFTSVSMAAEYSMQNSSGNDSDLYSGDAWFESQPGQTTLTRGDRRNFSQSLEANIGTIFPVKTPFPSSPSQFIIPQPSYQSLLHSLRYWMYP
jgi:hypothetical protein